MPATILVVDDDQTWLIDRLVGRSPALNELRDAVQRLSRDHTAPVLFVGETGTGRSLAARILHHASDRGARPFARVACAEAAPARFDDPFLDSLAGGTLFLSGIHATNAPLQDVLRRLVSLPDVRIVGSSDSRFDTALEPGTFAGELCERLGAEIVHVPPLRARATDIEPLIRHYVDLFNREFGKRIARVSPDAREALQKYTWPGNIRELRTVVERAVLVAESEDLCAADFALVDTGRRAGADMDLPPSGVNLERLERNLVIQALQRTGGNQTRAATLLGLNRDQVRYRIEKFGLPRS